jgi:hypothetical protein
MAAIVTLHGVFARPAARQVHARRATKWAAPGTAAIAWQSLKIEHKWLYRLQIFGL